MRKKPLASKPDPLGWCDCPSFTYYQSWMMCGHVVSHRMYHLVATKWPSMEIDVKLYGTKAVFIDRLAARGRGNSTFRYSAENPPYRVARDCPICACYFDTGQVLCGIHEPHRMLECGCKDFCTCPSREEPEAYESIDNFKKAKLSGGWEGHGKEFYKDYPPYHKDDTAYKLMGERVQRELDGTPTYDSEVFRRETRLAFEAKKLGIKPPGPTYDYLERDRDIKAMVPLGAYIMYNAKDGVPKRRYGFPKTDGLKLCPARKVEWLECSPITLDPETVCANCGGKMEDA